MPPMRTTPPEERFGKLIVSLWKQIRRKREEDELAYFTDQFESKVLNVISQIPKPKPHRQELLPRTVDPNHISSNNNNNNLSNGLSNGSANGVKKAPKLQRATLTGALDPVCPHTGRLHLTKSYPVSDSRELTFVPSAFADADETAETGDNDQQSNGKPGPTPMDEYFALFDVGARERAITDGPLYHVEEINDDLSETMRLCLDSKVYKQEVVAGGSINQEQVAHYLVTTLSRLADVDEDRIQKLYEIVVKDEGQTLQMGISNDANNVTGSGTVGDSDSNNNNNNNKHTGLLLNGENGSSSGSSNKISSVSTCNTSTSKDKEAKMIIGSPRRKTEAIGGRNSEERAVPNKSSIMDIDSVKSINQKSTTTAPKSPTPYTGPLCQPVSTVSATAVTEDAVMTNNEPIKPMNRLAEDDPEYLKLMDSYRKLYCNRCKIYDCNVHGLVEKPSLQLSYEIGITAERDRKVRPRGTASAASATAAAATASDPAIIGGDAASHMGPQQQQQQEKGMATQLTDFHKKISRRLFLIYEGDTEQMAQVMRADPEQVKQFVNAQGWTQPELRLVPPIKAETNPYHSLRNYNQHWYSRIIKSGLRPAFEPCVHDEPCREGICDCVERSIFCTDACAWGSRSKNFFRGCDCRSSCITSSCSCFANSRECNPDLCRCDTCTDPPKGPAKTQRCRNDNLSMNRDTEIVIGKSEVPKAGWGAFAKRSLAKGDFLGEYVGEMISQEEADRRGQLYDIRNHSSLFMLTADVALDADRKGNLMRYINHSATPNTTPRTITVNGDNRIGFFALQDIEAQTELTFNYGYNFSVNNDFVLKAAKAVPWMEVPSNPGGRANGNNANSSGGGNGGNTMKRGGGAVTGSTVGGGASQSKRKSSKPTARATSMKGGGNSNGIGGGEKKAFSTTTDSKDGPLDILGDIDATRDW